MPPLNDLPGRLERYLSSGLGAEVRVGHARQLAGGASRDTWEIDLTIASGPEAGGHALVLRCDGGGEIQEDALSREQEFRLLQVAHEAGLAVPRPRWLCTDPAILGESFFLSDRVPGEAVGRRIVKDPTLAEARQRLPRQMGEQLARIHALDLNDPRLSFLGQAEAPAQSMLTACARQLERADEPHPVLELALRWLRRRAPECPRVALCHGDFRLGNLMVGPEGLRAVFDWEFAHIGDPAEDLAWPAVRSWRFGNDRLRLGGIGEMKEFLDAYREAGGEDVSPERIAYWEIMGNLRWAVGCLTQARRHLTGQTSSVELAVLGRRTAEMELELIDLIEQAEAR